MRDNIVADLEKKGTKVSYTVITTQQQLFVMLWLKLEEELDEFNQALDSNEMDKILEEWADLQTVSNKLHTMIVDVDDPKPESYFRIIENLWQADWKINRYIKQSWHNNLQKMQDILEKKLQEKWWFDKWIYLISTEE